MEEYERIAPGQFLRAGATDDTTAAWMAIATKRPQATLCLLTALSIHDLTDEIPTRSNIEIDALKRWLRVKRNSPPRLLTIAKSFPKGRPALLARIAASSHRDDFVLEGRVLLAAFAAWKRQFRRRIVRVVSTPRFGEEFSGSVHITFEGAWIVHISGNML